MAFPKVITRVVDQSQSPAFFSRFRCGLVGVAARGPFNSILAVTSANSFTSQFGFPLAGSFLGDAVAMVSETSDGCKVVRVGSQYVATPNVTASGVQGSYTLVTTNGAVFQPGQYVKVSQQNLATTANARISTITGNTLNLSSVGAQAVTLADNYTAASVTTSSVADSATTAEASLVAPVYGTALAGLTVFGDKSSFVLTALTGTASGLSAGNVIKITQTGRTTTREARVKSIDPTNTVITLENNRLTDVGFQPVANQDSYTAATIQILTGTTLWAYLAASSAGTWANPTDLSGGLSVQVAPGSLPDTKKFLIYQGSTLVETIDNLSLNPASANYYVTVLNGTGTVVALSNYITLRDGAFIGTEPPENTYNGWNPAFSKVNVAIFNNGFNGENIADSDVVGTTDPVTGIPSGLKLFQSPTSDPNADVFVLCAPGINSPAVLNELARVSGLNNAVGVAGIPDNLNLRQAIDWQNGAGPFSANGQVNNYRLAVFWNWFLITDQFDNTQKWISPELGYLAAVARTYDQAKPWFAAAGDTRGIITDAEAVRYKFVSDADKDASYGNGNCVNSILLFDGNIEVYGNITMLRIPPGSTDKLTQLHVVHLVNYILKGFSAIARRYTFDPIDNVLFQQLTLDYKNFMEAVKSDRGVEDYNLILDSSNNTPATRNAQQVIVDLQIIPTSDVETFIITCFVNRSGATLSSVTRTPAL